MVGYNFSPLAENDPRETDLIVYAEIPNNISSSSSSREWLRSKA